MAELEVLLRHGEWLAVRKPTGIPTTAPPTAGVRSLVDRVREELAPRALLVHPLSRLDVEVTGTVLFALGHRAMTLAEAARNASTYRRCYLALVSPATAEEQGDWRAPIGTDPKDRTRRVANGGLEPQPALTRFTRVAVAGKAALLALELRTGRTHQARVHCSSAGHPILGDPTYGGARRVTLEDGAVLAARRVMLHAWQVRIAAADVDVRCPVDADMARLWAQLGGDAAALSGAPALV